MKAADASGPGDFDGWAQPPIFPSDVVKLGATFAGVRVGRDWVSRTGAIKREPPGIPRSMDAEAGVFVLVAVDVNS
jgi:hypothetical protein